MRSFSSLPSILFLGTLITACPSLALAEVSPLATDRPGNGNTTEVVQPLRLQVETSFNFSHEGDGTTLRGYTFPTGIRLGVVRRIELRLGTNIYGVTDGDIDSSDVADLSVGLKAKAWDNVGLRPALSFIAQLNLPTGAGLFTSNSADPLFLLLASWSLPAGFSFLTNLGFDVLGLGAGQTTARFLYVALLGYTLPVWSNRIALFVEGFGQIALRDSLSDVVQVDAGMAILITPDLQLDTFAQFGLNDASADVQVAVGFSYRFRMDTPPTS